MNIEQKRDEIAEELGAVYEISTILDSHPDDEPQHIAIKANDNAVTLLEYARGYVDKAFKCLDEIK